MMYSMPMFMNMQNTTETKSRPATPTDAASRCTVLWWYNDCMFLKESTTKYSSMTYHDYQDCIQACLDCAALCNHCASSLSLIHISEPTRRTPISYAVFC